MNGQGAGAIRKALGSAFHAGVYKAVLSDPTAKDARYRKITLVRQAKGGYLLEKLTKAQAFHEHLTDEAAAAFLEEALSSGFKQYNGWDEQHEYSIRVTSKGKVLSNRAPANRAPTPETSHDREKQYILPEGAPIPPLVDLGIFTKEGKVANPMRDKYRQINRFLELIADETDKLPDDRPLRVIDFGCGKSYLTFILYHFFTEIRRRAVDMTGLDLKRDVVVNCSQIAERYGYERLRFIEGDICDYQSDLPVDVMIALHACDVATDHALMQAIRWNAKLIFCAPCCQHELNAQIASDEFVILTRYGAVKERIASLMTDAVRANLLEAMGYRTQIVEFIDMEHTPKNLMLRARYADSPAERRRAALREVERLCAAFDLNPALLRLIDDTLP